VGDVRDRDSVRGAMKNVDFVFHAAALKQVPSCEFHPLEAVKTNILGTDNVVRSAIDHGVRKVICLSTDKAVYPINAMGMTKALMEKTMIAASRDVNDAETTLCGTRYGNVMASRGSVIPLMVDQILAGKPLTVTDPQMTRFMMSLEDAVDLVLYAFVNGRGGDIFVQKSPAATIAVLADSIRRVFGNPDHPISTIGTRHGEKLFEVLVSREEMSVAEDLGAYYRIRPDGRDLNYHKYFSDGIVQAASIEEYSSHNTRRLDVDEMSRLLLGLPMIATRALDVPAEG
jgi:UDP-glucose 4-epimerase